MFQIIIRVYNAEAFIQNCIDSVKNQKNKNWRCVVVNDVSTDNTDNIISKAIKDDSRFTYLINPTHCGSALESFINGVNVSNANDEDVLVVLDGDDSLESNCVEVLEKYYKNPTTLLTYGTFKYNLAGQTIIEPLSSYKIGENIRKTKWNASHCRSFKYKLFKKCPHDHFKTADGKYIGVVEDQAMMFALIELAGIENTCFVSEAIYNYNYNNPISDFRVKRDQQKDNETYIRNMTPVQKDPSIGKRLKIALVTIATNKYIKFTKPLYESAKKYFMPHHNVDFFCFTDSPVVPEGVIRVFQAHRPFPFPTLMRYHIITSQSEILKTYDAIYYVDSDMLFVDDIGNEILGDLVGTLHPGFHFRNLLDLPYERRVASTAFVPHGEGKHYFCGGFNGGYRYLDMAKAIVKIINSDLSVPMCAVWHDESYLNKFFVKYPPTLILSPSYCFPDPSNTQRIQEYKIGGFKPKVVALDKNHQEMR
jgi:histo-blood group ABO system transferase